jgi:hypothetical protein
MPYEIVVVPSAVAQVLSLDLDSRLLDAASQALQDLADNPNNCRRSAPPAEMPGYWVHEVRVNLAGRLHVLKWLFAFSDDGARINVLRFGHVEYAP